MNTGWLQCAAASWLAVLFPSAPEVHASGRGAPTSSTGERDELGVWLGVSPASMRLIGQTLDRGFVLANIRYGRLLASSRVSLKFTADLIPFALVTEPRAVGTTVSIYGAGIDPLGFQLEISASRVVRPFIAVSAGFLIFLDEVPVVGASQFTFTFGGMAGLIIQTGKLSVLIAYKYHHLSNAYTRPANPGIDSNFICLGLVFPFHNGPT